jgi:hypothetical protein
MEHCTGMMQAVSCVWMQTVRQITIPNIAVRTEADVVFISAQMVTSTKTQIMHPSALYVRTLFAQTKIKIHAALLSLLVITSNHLKGTY